MRVSYQLASAVEGVAEWGAGRFYALRLANSINDADTSGSIAELGLLNFAYETPVVTSSVVYELDTSAMTPMIRSQPRKQSPPHLNLQTLNLILVSSESSYRQGQIDPWIHGSCAFC